MIRKLVRQMLAAQVFSALTVSVCLMIDNIMIGRFLGVDAIAAYGLANPVLLLVGALGSMLSAGIQVACSKSLGRSSQTETNAGYSSALAMTAVISGVIAALVLIFRSPLAAALGAGHEGGLFRETKGYLAGFIIGAPGSIGALILVPFLQMAGQSGLLIVSVLTMTLADIGFDLLSVLVFRGGMFGMGLASALSYYAAMAVAAFYFLSKRCVFRFSRKLVTTRKIRELVSGGVPAVFNMLSTVISVYMLNQVLSSIGGNKALAAFTVITSLANAANCISTGCGGVSLTLTGILYNEEDRNGLKELIAVLSRWGVVLGIAMGAILLVFPGPLVGLFIADDAEAMRMAVMGLRIFSAGLIPCCINNALKNAYQATGRVWITEVMSLLEGAFFPVAAAWTASRFMGVSGVWIYFVSGEVLMLLAIGLYIRVRTGKLPWRDGAFLLLDKDFGVAEDDLMEADISTLEEVTAVAEAANRFCLEHGQSEKTSYHIGLCVEEMAGNTIQHGFTRDGKTHHLFLRVLHKPDRWVLRFRDDCGAFDPVHYVPNDGEDALGIRLVLAMADEARYTYSLNMNNLTVILR